MFTTRSVFSSLRTRLIVLVVLAAIPIFFIQVFSELQQRQIAAMSAQKNALQVAQLVSFNQGRLVEGARQLLTTLAHLPSVRTQDDITCNSLFQELLSEFPLYANLGVIERDGSVSCSGIPSTQDTNLADRSYFIAAIETNDFAVGNYQIGRITGRPSVNFGYPIREANGDISGVVFAALDLGWFDRLLPQITLPSGSSVSVIDREGTILAHYPDPERSGESLADTQLVQTILAEDEGAATVTGLDGVPQLVGFAPLDRGLDAGFVYVSVGIPTQVAFAEANQIFVQNLVGLFLVFVLTLGGVWLVSERFIHRPMERVLYATHRLSEGDLDARLGDFSGPREFQQLGHAFDQMARSLKQRLNERLAAEAALAKEREVNEFKSRFSTMVSHEFRVPLATIMSSSDLVKSYGDRLSDEKKDEYLDQIQGQVKRLVGLLDDILAISKAENMAIEFHPAELDIAALCEQIADEIRLSVGPSPKIIFTRRGDEFTAMVDKKLVRQIINNLMTNAVKYSPDGGTISIDLVVGKDEITITVADQGIGVPESDQANLFEIFHRSSNVGMIEGTGLGLTIVKQAVEAHGGTVTFVSTIGVGSTFTVKLPVSQPL